MKIVNTVSPVSKEAIKRRVGTKETLDESDDECEETALKARRNYTDLEDISDDDDDDDDNSNHSDAPLHMTDDELKDTLVKMLSFIAQVSYMIFVTLTLSYTLNG